MALLLLAAALIPIAATGPAFAQQPTATEKAGVGTPLKAINVGYVRHAVGAWATNMADGGFDVATGRTVRWFAHDTDSSLVVALSSGKLDIALIGAGVAASAYARGFDLRIFLVVCNESDSEGLLVAPNVAVKPGDLRSLAGKVIAVPFGSTPHLRLLEGLRRAGATLSAFRIVNLQTQQIAQAWAHGEVDAAVVSQPMLSQLEPAGTLVPLPRGGDQSSLLVFAATGEFVQQHTVFLSRFVDLVVRADDAHASRGNLALKDATELQPLSLMTGLAPSAVAIAMGQYRPPSIAEQASPQWLGGGAAAGLIAQLKSTLEIWRWAGRLGGSDPELSSVIAVEPVQMALSYRK